MLVLMVVIRYLDQSLQLAVEVVVEIVQQLAGMVVLVEEESMVLLVEQVFPDKDSLEVLEQVVLGKQVVVVVLEE